MYEPLRFTRNFILIIFAFLVTRKYVVSQKTIKLIVYLLLFTGVYAIIYSLFKRIAYIPEVTRYLDIRSIGMGTATTELIIIFSWAFLISKYDLFGSRFLTLMLVVLSIVYSVLCFSLTAYFMLLIIILIGIILAQITLRQKLKICAVLFTSQLCLLGTLSLGIDTTGKLLSQILYLVNQVAKQMVSLSSSPHFETRLLSWTETLSKFSGINFIYGIGFETMDVIKTHISESGVIVLGEPTYSTYLLKVGFIGC